MRHSSLRAGFVVAFALGSETTGPADTMADAARRFLATLSPELEVKAQLTRAERCVREGVTRRRSSSETSDLFRDRSDDE